MRRAMSASVRLAALVAWALVWAVGARDEAGARLLVAAGGNASCPWRVALQDERPGGAGSFELCTSALPVVFEGLSLSEDTPQVSPGTFSRRSPPPPRDPDASSPRDGHGGGDLRGPTGYVHLPGGGLYKVHEEKATWLEAKATCEAEGAHLVVIDSKEEADHVKAHLESKPYWRRERPFTFHAGFHMDFATPSGRPLASVGYERWAPGQPSASVCGRIDHDAWLLFGACSKEERFVCEFPASAPVPAGVSEGGSGSRTPSSPAANPQVRHADAHAQAQAPRSSSRSRVVSFKRHGLTLGNFRGNPWEDAKRACAAEEARVAVVESAAEAELLVDFFQGLPGDEPQGPTLVGLRTTHAVDVFGRPLSSSSYRRWAKKIFPETCVCVDIKILFHTCSCEDIYLSFLCKMSFI